MSVFVIAEAGANHDRDYLQALKLIDAAVAAKADAVKFQTYSAETLYAKNTPNFGGYENINDLIKRIELPREWQELLKKYCDDSGIEFMSTPFDERAVDELHSLGVERFKIAGFEATDPRLVKYIASTNLPLIISAGIGCDIAMVRNIYHWVLSVNPDPDVTFLHCNNAYPTPLKDICLGQMNKIAEMDYKADIKVGLSDHTEGILVPPLAVALGAKAIEKHFTLDRSLTGPDHAFAIEPPELKQMVTNIRFVESSRSQYSKAISESERGFEKARRSLVTKTKIKKGELLTEENVTTKRPSIKNSIAASWYYDIIGDDVITTKDLDVDQLIEWGDIKSLWQ